jgi:hypothetical protein
MDDVRLFMQYHAFAVWDFMSLVKALQTHYAPTSVPWFAPRQTDVSRFINEIVLAEESDVDSDGNFCSHYQMYLDAMKEVSANTEPIETFVGELRDGAPTFETIAETNLPVELKQFLRFTFETIESRDIHRFAAAFTLGREDIIPEMFLQVLKTAMSYSMLQNSNTIWKGTWNWTETSMAQWHVNSWRWLAAKTEPNGKRQQNVPNAPLT